MLDLRNPYHELRSLRSPQLWVQGWHLGTQNPERQRLRRMCLSCRTMKRMMRHGSKSTTPKRDGKFLKDVWRMRKAWYWWRVEEKVESRGRGGERVRKEEESEEWLEYTDVMIFRAT